MGKNLRKMASYYKPYIGTFILDMVFAFLASLISLIIPLPVRYITTNVIYMNADTSVNLIIKIGIALIGLVLIRFVCQYYIAYVGHVMGAKMEYDMRAEIFAHYQKL